MEYSVDIIKVSFIKMQKKKNGKKKIYKGLKWSFCIVLYKAFKYSGDKIGYRKPVEYNRMQETTHINALITLKGNQTMNSLNIYLKIVDSTSIISL